MTKIVDPVERDVDFVPPRVCDPRDMIAGKYDGGEYFGEPVRPETKRCEVY